MFVELHLLQNFAPSCLNRDDTNSPKDCEFGGYRRARISSQCLKRSIRHHPTFAQALAAGIGVRTWLLADAVAQRLPQAETDADRARTVSLATVEALMGKMKGDKTSVPVYLGSDETQRIADLIAEHWDEIAPHIPAAETEEKAEEPKQAKEPKKTKEAKVPKELKDAVTLIAKGFKSGTQAADIALFGRMVAENTNMNTDAACQVAHAVSTHKVSMEMDFYTAVDDLQPEDTTGAGMMGTMEYNSSCFYRYALIDLPQLHKNLAGDAELARQTVEAFIRASIAAIPTGKQNCSAAQNLPSFVMCVVRDGGSPWSLANAFEVPVRPGEGGWTGNSVKALDKHWAALKTMYGEAGIRCVALCTLGDAALEGLKDCRRDGVEDVITSVREAIAPEAGTSAGGE